MRAIVIGTFVVDGIVAIWLVASLAFGNGRLTAFDAMIIAALLMGFFAALGTMIGAEERRGDPQEADSALLKGAAMFDRLSDEAKERLRQHFPSGPVFMSSPPSDALQGFPPEPSSTTGSAPSVDPLQDAVN